VHQILFSRQGAVEPTGYARKATQSVQTTFVDHAYRLWNLDDATRFIEQHCSRDVAYAFDTLVPYAYKADVFKLCLLKISGGWVVDIGVRMLRDPLEAIAEQEPDFVLFRSTGVWDPPWNCSLALVYARPDHPVFDTALDWIVEHCRSRYYGHTPLMPTMSAFGRAVAHHQIHENTRVGTVVDVRWRPYKRAFDLKPTGLVAARKPAQAGAGDISGIGVAGSNNYYQLWRDRQIYGESSEPR
jgi:mannosyltransferase OCH1-like enzyme